MIFMCHLTFKEAERVTLEKTTRILSLKKKKFMLLFLIVCVC